MPAQQLAMQDLLCTDCSIVLDEDTRSHSELQVCDDCRNAVIGYCDFCGDEFMQEESDIETARRYGVLSYAHMTYVEGEHICTGCVQTCDDCGCEYAFESSMWDCCPSDDGSNGELHYYSFRPASKFWTANHGVVAWRWYARPNELYMGLEIEVEKASNYVHEMVSNDADEDWHNPNFYYWKSDGSLGSEGAEMVTMPATLEAHRRRFPFDKLEWLHAQGARAWGYSTCGMHIHVSRSAFTATQMWKFIKFHLANSDRLAQIAGRDSEQWASWSNDTMQEARTDTKKYVGRTDYVNRYSALNFNNGNTVELRYFRSNIAPHGIMRNIELVDAIYEYTKQMTVRDYIRDGWGFEAFAEWMQSKPEYGTIFEYMKREGIA